MSSVKKMIYSESIIYKEKLRFLPGQNRDKDYKKLSIFS